MDIEEKIVIWAHVFVSHPCVTFISTYNWAKLSELYVIEEALKLNLTMGLQVGRNFRGHLSFTLSTITDQLFKWLLFQGSHYF